MRQVLVRYKVQAGREAENETLIRKVFEELKATRPQGLRYASFKLEDGLTFVHLASIETPDGSNPLSESAAFEAFQAGIRDRCEVPPAAEDLQEIGSYRFNP
jgi:hypothetical protein